MQEKQDVKQDYVNSGQILKVPVSAPRNVINCEHSTKWGTLYQNTS